VPDERKSLENEIKKLVMNWSSKQETFHEIIRNKDHLHSRPELILGTVKETAMPKR